MRPLALLVALAWPAWCLAGAIEDAEVQYKNGLYILVLAADLDADFDAVYAIVTDYDQLERISRTLIEATRLPSEDSGHLRRRLVTNTCILIYCKRAVLVEDVEEQGEHTILATVVPELSDFRSGRTEWRVRSLGEGRSRIELNAQMEPGFWIPPVVGPWLIRKKMLNEARDTVTQIEKLVSGAP